MTRIEIGTAVGAKEFIPIDFNYKRTTKDGVMEIISYLVGTHFNERIDGVVTASSTGSIENDTLTFTSSKLEIAGDDAVGEATSTKIATHSTFMYFWPKTRIQGNAEIPVNQVPEISSNQKHLLRMRTIFTDVSSSDELIIDLEAGNDGAGSGAATDAELSLKETHGGITTTLATFNIPPTDLKIDWQIKFLDEGLTKVFYKTLAGSPTLLWKGTLTATVSECKVSHELHTNEDTPTRTVKTDFLWIFYPGIFAGYDIDMKDRMKGAVKIFDQNNTETESNWIRVYSKDHLFAGERVVENGLVRFRFKNTPEIQVYGWDDAASTYDIVGSIIPQDNAGNVAGKLQDVIFDKLNRSEAEIIVKFGIVDYNINFRKGMPWAWIKLNSKRMTFATTKERFALSANTPGTNLTKWNQEHSDDANRGNPLGTYQSATNPQIFTEDNNADTGLQHIDDNWFAVYTPGNQDIVGWLGPTLIPVTLEVEATSTSALKEIRFGWRQSVIVGVGVLDGSPNTLIGGTPEIFNAGNDDTYVKWRANMSIFTYDQKPIMRKRR